MHPGQPQTPCRRIGLGRISHTPRSASGLSSPAACNSDSSSIPDLKRVHQKLERIPSSNSLLDSALQYSQTVPTQRKEDLTSKEVSGCSSEDKSCSSREECDMLDASGLKKPKLDLLKTSPSAKDLNELRRNVMLKEKRLLELQNAAILRRKHDPDVLKNLIQHWLRGCQEALQELLSAANRGGNQLDMTQLLLELGIPASLVHYDSETQDFQEL